MKGYRTGSEFMFERELKQYLKEMGAALIGFADLSNVDTKAFDNMNFGIAFGINISAKIIEGINEGPTNEYYEAYNKINSKLDSITKNCEEYIHKLGYSAIGQTSTYVTSDNNLTTVLPHKTVATRAGLGWIGKNALLVTPEYGSAIRIASVITDMSIETNLPINASKCGGCNNCVKACPAMAIKGTLWNVSSVRGELLDAFGCRKKARELLLKNVGIEMAICGKCIEVCPYTKAYLKRCNCI